MNGPFVTLSDGEGRLYTVGPAGIIGRSNAAVCRIDHPAVSEAHAMVSLRGQGLLLVALRGTLHVQGLKVDEVVLHSGLRVRLAPKVELRVVELCAPERVLALVLGSAAPHMLQSPIYSVVCRPTPELVPQQVDGAPARVWSTADGWVLQVAQGRAQPLRHGLSMEVQGVELRCLSLSLAEAATAATVRANAGYVPLTVVLKGETIELQRTGRTPLRIGGKPGRLVCELAALGEDVHWKVAAAEIWRRETDPHLLRRRWDEALSRLRSQLREVGIRGDLVSGKAGLYQLYLLPGDRVDDRMR